MRYALVSLAMSATIGAPVGLVAVAKSLGVKEAMPQTVAQTPSSKERGHLLRTVSTVG